jgi:hypothetical protein
MFDFSIGRNKSLENAASKVLNEALSLNRMPAARSPITQRSVFAPQGSTEDALMNWRPGQRPLGGMEVPGGPIGGDQDAFERSLQRMGYSSSIDPETGKTVYSGGSKPSLTLGTRGNQLQQSQYVPQSRQSTQTTQARQYGEVRTTPGYMGQHPVTTRTVEQEKMDKEIVDRSAEEVFKREYGTSAPRGPGGEIMNPNTNRVGGSGALARSRQVDPERQRIAAERRQKDLERARAMGMTP